MHHRSIHAGVHAMRPNHNSDSRRSQSGSSEMMGDAAALSAEEEHGSPVEMITQRVGVAVDKAKEYGEKAKEYGEIAKRRASEAQQQITTFTRERPITTLLIAVG